MRNAYRVSVDKSEGEKSVERPGLRWEDNIKMNLKEICLYALDLSASE
jgi:hypothetical protein